VQKQKVISDFILIDQNTPYIQDYLPEDHLTSHYPQLTAALIK